MMMRCDDLVKPENKVPNDNMGKKVGTENMVFLAYMQVYRPNYRLGKSDTHMQNHSLIDPSCLDTHHVGHNQYVLIWPRLLVSCAAPVCERSEEQIENTHTSISGGTIFHIDAVVCTMI